MGFIIWDKIDRKPVGASQPQWFAEDDASTHPLSKGRPPCDAARAALGEGR
jgi:hypothetical protein